MTALDAAEAYTHVNDGERGTAMGEMLDAPLIFPLREHAKA